MDRDIKNMCGFYINDAHLSTMIFPHIIKKSNEKIITIFEIDIEKYINKLLENTNFNDEVKNKIEKIDWNRANEKKLKEINENIEDNVYVIIAGKMAYVNNMKTEIEKMFKNKKNITIISYYDIENFKLNIDNIIKENEYVVNTAGVVESGEYLKGNK